MRITVAMLPRLLPDPRRHVVAVVDVLRATTSLVTMFDGSLLRAIVSDDLDDARALASSNLALLCGEVNGVPPEGFDYGNSPAQFAAMAFQGKSAVLFTTNGTLALQAAAEAPFAMAAALRNRRTASERLIAEAAQRKIDIAVMCAGAGGGTAFSLEDTTAAGAIVEAVAEIDAAVSLSDEAYAALHLWHWYGRDAMRMFGESAHARLLRSIGFEDDLRYAAQMDLTGTVPVLHHENGTIVLRSTVHRGGNAIVRGHPMAP
jgi:2-phosphosulfolactate phosphatase